MPHRHSRHPLFTCLIRRSSFISFLSKKKILLERPVEALSVIVEWIYVIQGRVSSVAAAIYVIAMWSHAFSTETAKPPSLRLGQKRRKWKLGTRRCVCWFCITVTKCHTRGSVRLSGSLGQAQLRRFLPYWIASASMSASTQKREDAVFR